jgi:hypothetical protein
MTTGRFPPNAASEKGAHEHEFIETEVKQKNWSDFLNIFIVLATAGLVANVFAKVWNWALYGRIKG